MKNILLLTFAFLIFIPITTFGQESDIKPLPIGQKIEREIKGGEVHRYSIELKQGQAVILRVIESNADITLMIKNLPDKEDFRRANDGSGFGRETLTHISELTGVYLVQIITTRESKGKYKLDFELFPTVTQEITLRVEAERRLSEGFIVSKEGNKDNEIQRKAISIWEGAIPIWKKLGDKYWDAKTQKSIGYKYITVRDYDKALEFLNAALLLFNEIGDKYGQASTHTAIGVVLSGKGNNNESLEQDKKAVLILEEIGNTKDLAVALNNIGRTSLALGDLDTAISYLDKSLKLAQETKSLRNETHAKETLANVYAEFLGQRRKALQIYKEVMKSRQSLNESAEDEFNRLITLGNIAQTYGEIGDVTQQKETFDELFKFLKESGDSLLLALFYRNTAIMFSRFDEQKLDT